MEYSIINIVEQNNYQIDAARILTNTFLDIGNKTWPTIQSAIDEVEECIDLPNICIGLIHNNQLIGWVGLRPMYDKTWELHPLVVRTDYQSKGIGSVLLAEVEKRAREVGIIGIILGTDDEYNKTSLSEITIDENNIFDAIQNIKNIHNHPYEFYQKNGYMIVGIIPNANGLRKPDIWMWKSLLN
ncbi:TPA: aminoglycoside 6'-N-acetyltransferase AAC(6')-Iaj [Enterobacter hormaechei subsp. xiangfangensis]|uniref:Aminoglycoside 6'-N-acetyltransferase n=1 Tax=Pseudomonas aeruginosa TaxID=287 RepID=K0IV17_PSEAI|nr:aminoglycoside 6'-N-acetyltransferase AAC(6')-Iaj [Pseudomonas aeruginosa]BAM46120.1 aminoglycoside 6'-N-acetyltransferase [Pseudomonas aeruginosa]